MDRFKLGVDHGELDKPIGGVSMDIIFPARHCAFDLISGRRNEASLFDCAALGADPVRDASILARRLAASAHAVHQNPMCGFYESLREGKAFGHHSRGLVECCTIVQHFSRIGLFWRILVEKIALRFKFQNFA